MHHRFCIWLIPLFAAWDCGTALAEPIFRRTRPDPYEHVPALIKTLSSDLDDRRRADAASELRDYDPKTFTDIIPALIEALKNDASTSVRMEAAISIGKLRPISQIGGYALEQAEKNDPAIRVRAIATTHLKIWVLFHGYKPGRMLDPLANQTEEPPVVETPVVPPIGPTRTPKMPMNVPKFGKEPTRLAPPLMPSNGPAKDRFIPQLMKRLKPDVKPQADDGPFLNGPR